MDQLSTVNVIIRGYPLNAVGKSDNQRSSVDAIISGFPLNTVCRKTMATKDPSRILLILIIIISYFLSTSRSLIKLCRHETFKRFFVEQFY